MDLQDRDTTVSDDMLEEEGKRNYLASNIREMHNSTTDNNYIPVNPIIPSTTSKDYIQTTTDDCLYDVYTVG